VEWNVHGIPLRCVYRTQRSECAPSLEKWTSLFAHLQHLLHGLLLALALLLGQGLGLPTQGTPLSVVLQTTLSPWYRTAGAFRWADTCATEPRQ